MTKLWIERRRPLDKRLLAYTQPLENLLAWLGQPSLRLGSLQDSPRLFQ